METEIQNTIPNIEPNRSNETQNVEHSTIINSNNRIVYADHEHDRDENKSNYTLFIFIFAILIIILIFIIILFAISFLNGSNIVNNV